MTSLREQLDDLRVRATTPDGAMTAELHGRSALRLTFARGWYDRSTDDEVTRKLTALAGRLWVARTREYWRILGAESGEYLTGEDRALGTRADAYREGRNALVAEGRSENGRVTIRVSGMRSWTVDVIPGTIHTCDEHEFAAMVEQAGAELIRDQYRKIARLKGEIYA
ncbi:hypothetical protein AB0F81_36230 [Actinoplanes sp. NPDC024001]|uniref:hypothetical protein n=1 Tax=Actinoplanes sp. NPDC024001 TaxID=3154598 RepID=UPI0033D02B40